MIVCQMVTRHEIQFVTITERISALTRGTSIRRIAATLAKSYKFA